MFYSHKVAQLLAHNDPANRELAELLATAQCQNATTTQEFWQQLQQTYFLSALKAWEWAFWRHPETDFFDRAALDQHFQAHFDGLNGLNLEIPLPLRIVFAYEQLENDSYLLPQGLYGIDTPKTAHQRRVYKEQSLDISIIQAYNLVSAAQLQAQLYAQLPHERQNCYRQDLFPPQTLQNGLSRQDLTDLHTHFTSIFSRQKALECKQCGHIGHNQFTRCHWRPIWLAQALAAPINCYFKEDSSDYLDLEPVVQLYFDGLWEYSTSNGPLQAPNPLDAAPEEQFLLGVSAFLVPLVALQKEEEKVFSFSTTHYLDGEYLPNIKKGFAAAIHLRQT